MCGWSSAGKSRTWRVRYWPALRWRAAEVIVVMDADLSHPPERLPALVAPLLDGSHDIAVGSRYVAGGSTEGCRCTAGGSRAWAAGLPAPSAT